MFKYKVLQCLYKNIVRIPKDFTTKSNFTHEYELIFHSTSDSNHENEINKENNKKWDIKLLFESIIHSNIDAYSPYDSALFFHSLDLVYKKGQKVDTKSDKLYIRARDLLLRDMAKYRNELIPYFFDKLSTVKDTNGLANYIESIDTKSIENTSPSVLCDIVIKLTRTFRQTKSAASLENVLNSEFFKCVISKLSHSSSMLNNSSELKNQFNPQNMFKVIYGLAKLGYITDNSIRLLHNLIPIVIRHIEGECPWDSKTVLRMGWAYHKFEMIDRNLFAKIANLILACLDDFDYREIGLIQDIYTRDDIWNERLLMLTKSRLHTFLKYGAYSGQIYK